MPPQPTVGNRKSGEIFGRATTFLEEERTGTIRVFMREPEEEVCLTVGQTYSVRP